MTDETKFVRPGMAQVTTANRGRFYLWKRERYYSVTTIISGGVPKEALIGWAAKMTAIGAIKEHAKVGVLIEGEDLDDPTSWGDDGKPITAGAATAYKLLSGYRFESRDKAANLGTLVHDITEAHVLGKPIPEAPDDAQPYVEAFLAFLDDFEPEFEAVEAPVFSRAQKYAGTLDAIAVFPTLADHPMYAHLGRPPRLIIDYKSGKGVYSEVGLQLAAYRFADTFLGMPDGSEAPMPEVDGGAVVHLRPDGYELVPVRCDEEIFNAFLYAREIYRWGLETSRDVIGNPLKPVVREEVAS